MKYLLIMALIAGLAACSDDGPEESLEEPIQEGATETTDGEAGQAEEPEPIEVVTEQLEVPWAIEKSGETLFITERNGSIVTIEEGRDTRAEVVLEHDELAEGEGGLLGFVLSPDYAEDGRAFVYHTYQEEGQILNRIAVISQSDDDGQWIEEEEVLAGIPGGRIHNGGRLAMGPDEKLYATTGDAGIEELAQEREAMAGTILRLELDGTVPDDNPWEDSYVYSYGHRNPQGLAWDEDGTLYSSEHGSSAYDEINLIEAGVNYGWPIVRGDETEEGLSAPLIHSGEDTWAPSGAAVAKDVLYVAGLRGEAIYALNLQTSEFVTWLEGFGRIRDLFVDGQSLYFITNNRDGRGVPQDSDDYLIKVDLEQQER
ncbi:sorbosone dehydrogenase family protein [Alkalihalobacillus oceani]|uniref:PQQ-dependent sugar dehydrogenase n=1 Tax=Halalkalibacter oceani TaxID=1653776 RepID=UPI00203DB38D|nr:PQQ-dependent sugar dehydrogenase [Halalkalibacter oceani]MCM3760163.1 sorbosone dehydrogenase family protein [Halalkalibacter oceani]